MTKETNSSVELCSKCGKTLGPVRISLFNGEKMHYACAVEFDQSDSWDSHVADLNTTIGRLECELAKARAENEKLQAKHKEVLEGVEHICNRPDYTNTEEMVRSLKVLTTDKEAGE